MEPIHVAQTFEPEHVASPLEWWKERGREAAAKGATWPRYSWRDEEPRGLLFEAWVERPDNEGAQRWSFTAETPEGK